jgi:hypothetical protein
VRRIKSAVITPMTAEGVIPETPGRLLQATPTFSKSFAVKLLTARLTQ